ncbi:hypothetical protein TNCV_932891 [Trichonephila clavipes]|nr:hypothetical protein TNCV_932891 [Trichonephila clavipes]
MEQSKNRGNAGISTGPMSTVGVITFHRAYCTGSIQQLLYPILLSADEGGCCLSEGRPAFKSTFQWFRSERCLNVEYRADLTNSMMLNIANKFITDSTGGHEE